MSDHPGWKGPAIAELAAIEREQDNAAERRFAARQKIITALEAEIGAALKWAGFPEAGEWHTWREYQPERQTINTLANLMLSNAVRQFREAEE